MTVTTSLVAMLFVALVIGTAMIGGIWWRQERIAYQPPLDVPVAPPDVRRIDYVAADGQPLLAYVVAPRDTPRGVVVAFHGNADLAAWQVPWAREIASRTRWCVFLAEYRGYGGLSGTPTYPGVQADARAAWTTAIAVAADLALDPYAFALFGHSLGSGVACELAAEILRAGRRNGRADMLAGIVLQSPFTSARDMARIVSTRPVHWLWRVISRVHYDTRRRFQEIDVPVSIAHGARDWLVPVAMGRELFSQAIRPGDLLIVDNASHNDVAEMAGERYWSWFSNALTSHLHELSAPGSRHRTEIRD